MVPPMPGSTLGGWAGPLLVTALGTFLRFYRLGQPHAVLFDGPTTYRTRTES